MSDAGHDYLPTPIGERLRAAREEKGLSLDDVARLTRIPTRHLQHIDESQWDALPATTYAVGFARSYANAVGMNGNEIGVELRQQLGKGPTYAAAPTAYYEPADPTRVPPRSLAIVAAVVAVLLIVGYLLWRSGSVDDSAVDPAEIAIAEAPVTAPTNLQAADPQAAQPLGGPSAAAGAGGPVTILAVGDVWMRVYEQGGARLYENTLAAGERYVVPSNAVAPLILTGRPDALRVTVGTTEIPQLGPAERTIADVSLRPADLLARVGGAGTPAGMPPPAGQ